MELAMTLIVVGDQSPNNLKVMTMMTRVQECKYYIGACNFKGLFIYYVILDGGGGSYRYITILHGGGLPRPPNCIT